MQYIHQMQDFTMQFSEAFMHFMGSLYTGVRPATKGIVLVCVWSLHVYDREHCTIHMLRHGPRLREW